MIWVADLGQLLGAANTLNTDRAEIPVIAVEEQDMLVGLAVDHIVGMEWLDVEQLQQLTQVTDMARFIRGEWVLNEQTHQRLQLLDQKAIVHSERWAA